jgi:hypothetical protein
LWAWEFYHSLGSPAAVSDGADQPSEQGGSRHG